MEDTNLLIVARKSIKGVAALTSRNLIGNILGIVANFVLTLYLSPENIGVFFVVSAIVVFLNYFQDIGLAASLIQKKDEPTLSELRTVFTAQQLLVLSIVIPAMILSAPIASYFHLDASGLLLLRAFLVSFFLSSLRTIPTVILERGLQFDKLVIPQIVETIIYNGSLIVFVILGFGVDSFTIAVLGRSIVGLVLLYVVQPWQIGFAFSKIHIKKLLTFGVPFQMNSLLALVKDDLLSIYIATVLPLSQVGYIGFAQKWAFMPLRIVMDNVIKVTFPSFSRLQDDPQALKKLVEKSLMLIALFIFPVSVSIIFFTPYIVDLIPKYQKWTPALLALSFFSLNALFASVTVPLTNFLNAIGKIKTTLGVMIFLTIATWVLTPILIHMYGYNGVALASFLVAASAIIVVYFVKKHIAFSFVKPISKPLLAAGIMIAAVLLTKNFIHSFISLGIIVILCWGVYALVYLAIARKELYSTIQFLTHSMKHKS